MLDAACCDMINKKDALPSHQPASLHVPLTEVAKITVQRPVSPCSEGPASDPANTLPALYDMPGLFDSPICTQQGCRPSL